MKTRIFLTGASGYLGSLLMERLAALPEVESITGIALSNPRAPLPPKVKFRQMDMRSPDLAGIMAGHDVVVHTACIVLWPAKMSVAERDDINFNGVRNVARAAMANKITRFIHTSSMAAYDPDWARGKSDVTEDSPTGRGDSAFYYWNAKAGAENALREMFNGSSTVLTFLRPIYIIGPRNRSNAKSYRKNAINFPGQNPRRQFIHEEDVVAAFIQALRTDMPGAYNVVPDDFLRIHDVWKIAGAKFVPTVPLWLASWLTGVRWRFLGSPYHTSWVRDMLVDFTGSNAKLKDTGWRPRFNSEQALRSAF
jgi:nucleoside-diphosphate-sugar epimerase